MALEEPSIEGESSWDLLGLIVVYKGDTSQREWVTFAKKFLVGEVGGFETIAVAASTSADPINGSATTRWRWSMLLYHVFVLAHRYL